MYIVCAEDVKTSFFDSFIEASAVSNLTSVHDQYDNTQFRVPPHRA